MAELAEGDRMANMAGVRVEGEERKAAYAALGAV